MGESFEIEIPLTVILRATIRNGDKGYERANEVRKYLQERYPKLKIGDLIWDVDRTDKDTPLSAYSLKIGIPFPEELSRLAIEIKQKVNTHLRTLSQIKGDDQR